MSGSTKEARLNIRYPDFEIIDEVEIDANRMGLKKNAWIKEAIVEKLENSKHTRLLEAERLKGDFESRKLIEWMAGPELTQDAKDYVADFFEKITDHASR